MPKDKKTKNDKTSMTPEEMALQKQQKKSGWRKKLKYGSLATVVAVIFVVVVVLINIIVSALGNRYPAMTIDLTSANVYEISDETLDYIRNLDVDVEIAVSTEESAFSDSYNRVITETLSRYESYSSHISVTYFDTTKDPDVLAKYQALYSGDIGSGQIIVTSGDRIKVYSISDMYELDEDMLYYYYYGYVSYEDIITGFKGEQVLTTAIMNVTDSNPKTVGVIYTLNDDYIFSATQENAYSLMQAETLLDENGYDIVEMDLNDDFDTELYDILLLPAPVNDLTTDAVERLSNFLYNDGDLGKQLIYVADCSQGDTPNLNAFLKEWNISVESSYVLDDVANCQTVTTVSGSGSVPVVTASSSTYTGNLANTSLPIVAPLARNITELTANNGRTVENLLTSTDSAYAMPLTDSDNVDTDNLNRAENAVMVLCRDQQSTGSDFIESDVIVLGSMLMLDYYLLQDNSYNNAEFFIGVLNQVCDKEDNIVIATKDMTKASISTSELTLKVIRVIVIYIIPIIVILIGIGVAIRRRRR